MCGITGVRHFGTGRVDEDALERMTRALRHRGPDDHGVFVDVKNGVALGNQRLAVLDLSPQGHMPMANRKKTLWVTYNGEIYNFREIRRELETRGRTFLSSSDTEVLLEAYEEWGMKAVEKFRGMFAFALWDAQKEELILVRDRAGVKPLYWYRKDDLLLFASEIKAFHEHPLFRKELNPEALSLFLQLGYIPAPHTIFQNAYKLKPGHYARFTKEGNGRQEPYWDIAEIAARPEILGSEEEVETELETLLLESFQYRMVSDVPVGVFLSGGVDSSTVAALLQSRSKTPLKTFTIGFREKGYDEAPFAKRVAEFLGTDHHELYCTKEMAFSVIPKLADMYDEPFGDSSAIPTYLVSKFAREQVKVVLSGDGGDELFGGYTKYIGAEWYYRKANRLPKLLLRLLPWASEILSPEAMELLYQMLPLRFRTHTSVRGKLYKLKDLLRLHHTDLPSIFRTSAAYWTEAQLAKLFHENSSPQEDLYGFEGMKHLDPFSQMQVADFKVYLADDILTKVDRATMAVGLEAREPFLDYKLVEYAAHLPSSFKFRKGRGKYILKKILAKYLPEKLIERPKQGFGIPISSWLRQDLAPFLHAYLVPEKLRTHGLFDERHVQTMVKGFYAGRRENASRLWFLLMFQMWHERWMG